LILPHFPYVLEEDCSFDPKGERTSPLKQSRCTNQLIIEFVELLKELGRFDNSLIVIQSDHGGRFAITDGELQNVEEQGYYSEIWSRARSRSLLLVKPAGTSAGQELAVSNVPATLMDIASTMFQSLGLDSSLSFEGIDLMNPSISALERERYYHFFEKKGPDEWTDKMVRFRIDGSQLVWDSEILLTKNDAFR
jgi:phosphoglycerol transferase MdoB-like AlkP superfamily enzyme